MRIYLISNHSPGNFCIWDHSSLLTGCFLRLFSYTSNINFFLFLYLIFTSLRLDLKKLLSAMEQIANRRMLQIRVLHPLRSKRKQCRRVNCNKASITHARFSVEGGGDGRERSTWMHLCSSSLQFRVSFNLISFSFRFRLSSLSFATKKYSRASFLPGDFGPSCREKDIDYTSRNINMTIGKRLPIYVQLERLITCWTLSLVAILHMHGICVFVYIYIWCQHARVYTHS